MEKKLCGEGLEEGFVLGAVRRGRRKEEKGRDERMKGVEMKV